MNEKPQNRAYGNRHVDVVSNVCGLRVGQLETSLAVAERELARKGKSFLSNAPMLLLERNQKHLDEIATKALEQICPDYVKGHFHHLMGHYTVQDGRINQYVNLDPATPVIEVYSRMKHPCSLAEKAGRNTAKFGRVSESRDPHRFMVGDILGMEFVVKGSGEEADQNIQYVRNKLLAMPCFTLEKEEDHAKDNGYRSKHLNILYANGNPETRWLEVEVQITAADDRQKSKEDPTQAHDTTYAREKLLKPRTLYGHQLVIVGNSVHVDRNGMNTLETEEFLIVPEVPNDVQKYTLVVPKA